MSALTETLAARTSLTDAQVEALLTSQEGQRKWPRPEGTAIVRAEGSSDPRSGRLRTY